MSTQATPYDFEQAPLVVIWEITRACALACKHCRAEAKTRRDPDELSFADGCRLMDQVAAMGSPVFVLTGGDPLLRPDFYDLIRYGTKIGLRVSGSPSGTKLATPQAMQKAAEAGLKRVQFSLDGASSETHDAFRRVNGSFEWTLNGMRYAQEASMELQIGTTVSRYNLEELNQIAELVEKAGCTLWSLFFLVPVGRGQAEDMISPEEGEQVLNWLCDLSQRVPFAIKTTEAPFFRRVLHQRLSPGSPPSHLHMQSPILRPSGAPVPSKAPSAAPGLPMPGQVASYGVNDGKGFMFIDHQGEVFPSGFLPIPGGNFHEKSLQRIYQESPLFVQLRNPNLLKGKCGICEYRSMCGGSRARAYALTDDFLQSDPSCAYIPK